MNINLKMLIKEDEEHIADIITQIVTHNPNLLNCNTLNIISRYQRTILQKLKSPVLGCIVSK